MAGLFKVVMTWARTGAPANPFVNVFGYRSNLYYAGDETDGLSQAFRAQLVPELVKVHSSQMSSARCEVYNVTNGVGYNDFVYTTPAVGARGGDPLPNFNAWGFQFNRVNTGERNGFKRLGAIAESDTAGDVASTAMLAILNTLATELFDPLQVGVIDTWFPEILERKPTGVYPWTSHAIGSVSYKRITTQNSRKR